MQRNAYDKAYYTQKTISRGAVGAPLAHRKVFTTGQIAEVCAVAPRTVSKWIDCGALIGFRIPGSQDRRVNRDNLIRFMLDNSIPLGVLGITNYSIAVCGLQNEKYTVFSTSITSANPNFACLAVESEFHLGYLVGKDPIEAVVLDFSIGRSKAFEIARLILATHPIPIFGLVEEDECSIHETHQIFAMAYKKPLSYQETAWSVAEVVQKIINKESEAKRVPQSKRWKRNSVDMPKEPSTLSGS